MYTCWAVKDNINQRTHILSKYSLKSNVGNFTIHSSERFSLLHVLGYLKFSYLEEMTKS